jgi:predicted methyltransferase
VDRSGLAAPTAISQTAPDYAAIVAAPDRSDADRKLDTNRAPAQWLAFIGAKPGMKILDIFGLWVEGGTHGASRGAGR